MTNRSTEHQETCCAAQPDEPRREPTQTNQAWDFHLPRLDGGDMIRLSETLNAEGRRCAATIFWSSVCSHCVRYDSFLNALAERTPEISLTIIAARRNESPQQLRAAVESRKLKFLLLHDADRAVARAQNVEQTPCAFLTDTEGIIRYRGAIDNFTDPRDPAHEPYLAEAIEDLLQGRAVARAETPSYGCPIDSVYYDLP